MVGQDFEGVLEQTGITVGAGRLLQRLWPRAPILRSDRIRHYTAVGRDGDAPILQQHPRSFCFDCAAAGLILSVLATRANVSKSMI